MAALGAWLGIINGLVLLAAVSVSAVLIGVAISLRRRRAAQLAANMSTAFWGLVCSPKNLLTRRPVPDASTGGRLTMPYGLAICAGSCISAVCVLLWRM